MMSVKEGFRALFRAPKPPAPPPAASFPTMLAPVQVLLERAREHEDHALFADKQQQRALSNAGKYQQSAIEHRQTAAQLRNSASFLDPDYQEPTAQA